MTRRIIASAAALLVCLLPASAGNPERGVASLGRSENPFIEKGSWMLGGTVSASSFDSKDLNVAVVRDADTRGLSFGVQPDFLYAITDDFALGVSGIYRRGLTSLESVAVAAGETSLDIKDFNSISQKYGAALFCRKYFPLGHSGRFAIHIDGEASFTGGDGKISCRKDGQIAGTYEKSFDLGVFLNPGLSAFITPHLVISAGVGLAGVGYSWVDQIHNQVATGARNGFSASFIINPLALSVGVYYCF